MRLVRRCQQRPAIRFDDRAADRQPHADPIGLGRVERLEQPVEIRRIDPRAGIVDFDEHAVGIALAGGNRKLARSVSGAGHRLNGVDHQIHDHLLQLDTIRRNERQVVRKPRPEPDAAAFHFGLGQRNDLVDRLIDVRAVSVRRHLSYQPTNAIDDLAGAIAVPDDTAERLPDLVQSGLSRVEPTQTRVGVGDDRRNRLIDLVRDRGRHLPQQHDPVETCELALGLLQSLLGTLSLGDVDDDCAEKARRDLLSQPRKKPKKSRRDTPPA
jgi:hypothetical protein